MTRFFWVDLKPTCKPLFTSVGPMPGMDTCQHAPPLSGLHPCGAPLPAHPAGVVRGQACRSVARGPRVCWRSFSSWDEGVLAQMKHVHRPSVLPWEVLLESISEFHFGLPKNRLSHRRDLQDVPALSSVLGRTGRMLRGPSSPGLRWGRWRPTRESVIRPDLRTSETHAVLLTYVPVW